MFRGDKQCKSSTWDKLAVVIAVFAFATDLAQRKTATQLRRSSSSQRVVKHLELASFLEPTARFWLGHAVIAAGHRPKTE